MTGFDGPYDVISINVFGHCNLFDFAIGELSSVLLLIILAYNLGLIAGTEGYFSLKGKFSLSG
jgi:hypothetical protein